MKTKIDKIVNDLFQVWTPEGAYHDKCYLCNKLDITKIEYVEDGNFAYCLEHTPMELHDGMVGMFAPIDVRTRECEYLYTKYADNDLAFIGRCEVTYATDFEIKKSDVYIVKCLRKGNTYFVSASAQALYPFVQHWNDAPIKTFQDIPREHI